MRSKEFIYFIIIFTIVYTIFFVLYDRLSIVFNNKRLIKSANSLVDINQFMKFANFYNLQGTITKDKIIEVFMNVRNMDNINISVVASSNGISCMEFVIVILYLEYLKLLNAKIISLDNNCIKVMTYKEQNIIFKYSKYLNEKKNYDFITQNVTGDVLNELNTISMYFLIPGVRLIDSKLYYVGDYL